MEIIIIILSAITFGNIMFLFLYIKIGIVKQRMIDNQRKYIFNLEDSYKKLKELDNARREYCEILKKQIKQQEDERNNNIQSRENE